MNKNGSPVWPKAGHPCPACGRPVRRHHSHSTIPGEGTYHFNCYPKPPRAAPTTQEALW